MSNDYFPNFPLAYHITFSCYGGWLHGDPAGSVDRHLFNCVGAPLLPPSPKRVEFELQELKNPPYELDPPRRKSVMEAIREVCDYRGWVLLAAHVRRYHVHIVVRANANPEKVMNDFKAYSSRRLNREGFDPAGCKRWERHGSTKYKWTQDDVESAVGYVLYKQGEPMEIFQLT